MYCYESTVFGSCGSKLSPTLVLQCAIKNTFRLPKLKFRNSNTRLDGGDRIIRESFLIFHWRRFKAETVAEWRGIVDFLNAGMVYVSKE